jgi:hypothetical protein
MNNIPFRDSVTEQRIFECKLTQKNEGRRKKKEKQKRRMKSRKKEWQNSQLVVRPA